jgi:hypothetical protein
LCDCIVEYYDNFRDKIKFQKKLKNEMMKKFGKNKPNNWKYTIRTFDNCVVAEHKSTNTYF